MYHKEIIYIGLYKDGSRVGNAGFLKVENREEESRLDLQLKNLPLNIRGKFPIRIHNGNDWKEVNGVSVQEGSGSWEEKAADTAQRVQIQIMLPGGYSLEGRSKNALPALAQAKKERKEDVSTVPEVKKEVGTVPEKKEKQTENVLWTDQRNELEKEVWDLEPSMAGNSDAGKKQSIPQISPNEAKTIVVTEKQQPSPEQETMSGGRFVPEPSVAYSLKEDKWEQILDSYEQIHPYGDERVYIKLEPKDFIILQSKYQHLVNNSFLLHGFYNYRYVILGKENDYYLGVPGVFYEREKMVALMFGFEAFECPGGIAQAGEFGYYLRKVEI